MQYKIRAKFLRSPAAGHTNRITLASVPTATIDAGSFGEACDIYAKRFGIPDDFYRPPRALSLAVYKGKRQPYVLLQGVR